MPWRLAAALAIALPWPGPAAAGSAPPLRPALAGSGLPLVPVAVFGRDERRPLQQSRRDLHEALGLLYDDHSRLVCTAFCVARDVVATAAHCIHGTGDRPPPRLSGLSFRHTFAERRGLARIAGAAGGTAAQHIMSGSTRLSVRPPIDATSDWALVRLDRRACTRSILALADYEAGEVAELAAAGRVYQVAFHRDFADWRLAIGTPCKVSPSFEGADRQTIERDFDDAGNLVLHDCDTGAASSGSPLLVDGPRGPEVVAVNVGTYVLSKVLMNDGEIVKRFRSDTIANTALSATILKRALTAFERAEILAEARDVAEVQHQLARRGYYEGASDGVYGPQTRAAIERVEAAWRMAPTGLATRSLLLRLQQDSLAVAPAEPARHSQRSR
ncbi:MAG: peptidoglycan-binding protein [Pseudomonadota bacterium]